MQTTEMDTGPGAPPARVRHQVRDAFAVMAFSAAASGALAAALVLLGRLVG